MAHQPTVIQTWVRIAFIIHISYASSSFDPWTLHPDVFEMLSHFPFPITGVNGFLWKDWGHHYHLHLCCTFHLG